VRIALVLGTRPEIIKMSPVIKQCQKTYLDFFVIHTGQHYSYALDTLLFRQLGLPKPKYNLNVGSGTHGAQTGKMLAGIEKILNSENPDMILVEGDTNSVLAGALAAYKMGLTVGHIEAGLRSYDRSMPEEVNRVLTDHCSDLCFAPTPDSQANLLREGIARAGIHVTGNPIVDAVYQNVEIAKKESEIIDDLGIGAKEYLLATAHRQENVDDAFRFRHLIRSLERVSESLRLPVIYPVHYRARKMMDRFKLMPEVTLINPLDFFSFLILESNAALILTDSGGVQEEACILGTPCVTLRENTERPETLKVGANVLAGTNPESVVKAAEVMIYRTGWSHPFGDGRSAERITDITRKALPNFVTSRSYLKKISARAIRSVAV
jgi:UDP-N-acetylglucosamine 2-epimerase (non-hydrolysing)